MNKTRDHLTRTEHTTAEGISHKNLQGNEQATQAMSEKKPAQSHVQSCRIDECLFETTSSDLGVAQSQPSTYNAQTNVSNQLIMDMQKLADPQRKEFEREIDKLRQEQVDLIPGLTSQILEGNLGPQSKYQPPTKPCHTHLLPTMSTLWQDLSTCLDVLVGDLLMMMILTMMAAEEKQRKTRIRKKQAEGNQDAGAVVIFPHHPLRVHHLSRRPQVLRNRLCGQENIGAV